MTIDRYRPPGVPEWSQPPPERIPVIRWQPTRDRAVEVARPVARGTGRAGMTAASLWWRIARRSPHGLWRIICALVRWNADLPTLHLWRLAIDAGDYGAAAAFAKRRKETICERLQTTAYAAAALFVVAGVLVTQGAWWHKVLAVLVGGLVLGWIGRDRTQPVIPTTTSHVIAAEVPPVTPDALVKAFAALPGPIGNAVRADQGAVSFAAPVQRDGKGWRADVDLPAGIPAGDLVDRREELAAGLRRQESAVWVEACGDVHASRAVIWVGDKPLSQTPVPPWPLATRGAVNLFEAFDVGVDYRGRPISLTLAYASVLIGAVPRQGKTAAMRQLLLAATLDPRAQVSVIDGKGGGDYAALAPVLHFYRAGDDPEDVEAVEGELRRMREDMSRRYRTLRSLPTEVCPDSKTTDQLASRRELGLHPVVFAIDESQIYFSRSKEIREIVEDLVRRGPACGIIVLIATQRPDNESVPSSISSNAVLRICLKVMGHVANDLVLGTGMYKAGIRATQFSRSDQGVAYLAGEGDDPVIVRFHYVDAQDARTVVARAYQARQAKGLLTGMAAGETEEDDRSDSILDHMIRVWPKDTEKVRFEELAKLLEPIRGAMTPEAVSAEVRAHGIDTVQVNMTVDGVRSNRRGLTRSSVLAALSDREAPPDDRSTGASPLRLV